MFGLEGHANGARILVIDDDAANTRYLELLLQQGGYGAVLTASSGLDSLARFRYHEPDLVLLDLHMPDMSGYEILEEIHHLNRGQVFVPVLVFTADTTKGSREHALRLGASDFLTKPCDSTEILLRIRNFLAMRSMHRKLAVRNEDLEAMVRARTRELESAQTEIVERLGLAGEYRDDDTGEHARRVGELSADLASKLGFAGSEVETIRFAARLHDLGKLGIPDRILLKPSRLSAEEIRIMQGHAELGAAILANSQVPVLRMAESIARYHHEWFDGSGYPDGIAGESIPLEGRIVAVADVYDALTHERPYKAAWSSNRALSEIKGLSGLQFDPAVVEALNTCLTFREPLAA